MYRLTSSTGSPKGKGVRGFKDPERTEQVQKLNTEEPPLDPCCLDDFQLGPVLGTGSFGRVSLARHRPSSTICAIKALSKAHIVKHQQVLHVKAEKEVLRQINHTFTVRLLGGFQDPSCVFFVLEYVPGGEFFRHLKSRGRLSEDVARYYAAQVLLAFEYLHMHGFVYRDLKPENLLLDSEGHVRLTDFGFAKYLAEGKRTYTLCGTPDYIAPEIILNKCSSQVVVTPEDDMYLLQGHGKAVDWWSFGVLLFEMMAGYPPFYDEDVTNTYKKILSANGGISDIKTHPFFKPIDWTALAERKVEPPFKPNVKAADDHSNFDDYSGLKSMTHEFELSKTEQAMFVGF